MVAAIWTRDDILELLEYRKRCLKADEISFKMPKFTAGQIKSKLGRLNAKNKEEPVKTSAGYYTVDCKHIDNPIEAARIKLGAVYEYGKYRLPDGKKIGILAMIDLAKSKKEVLPEPPVHKPPVIAKEPEKKDIKDNSCHVVFCDNPIESARIKLNAIYEHGKYRLPNGKLIGTLAMIDLAKSQ